MVPVTNVVGAYPQDLLAELIKYVCCEASMRTEHLSLEHVAHPKIPFGDESNMLTMRIHYHVFIGLLEPHHHIHQLELPRHHYGGIFEYVCSRMLLTENAIWVLRDVNRRKQVVVFWTGIV